MTDQERYRLGARKRAATLAELKGALPMDNDVAQWMEAQLVKAARFAEIVASRAAGKSFAMPIVAPHNKRVAGWTFDIHVPQLEPVVMKSPEQMRRELDELNDWCDRTFPRPFITDHLGHHRAPRGWKPQLL